MVGCLTFHNKRQLFSQRLAKERKFFFNICISQYFLTSKCFVLRLIRYGMQAHNCVRTTSMICCRVSPNLSLSGSDSLSTGLSRLLYLAIRSLISRRSFGPDQTPEQKLKETRQLWSPGRPPLKKKKKKERKHSLDKDLDNF